jgi:hypothetical protein
VFAQCAPVVGGGQSLMVLRRLDNQRIPGVEDRKSDHMIARLRVGSGIYHTSCLQKVTAYEVGGNRVLDDTSGGILRNNHPRT